jgi:hypothetical protein
MKKTSISSLISKKSTNDKIPQPIINPESLDLIDLTEGFHNGINSFGTRKKYLEEIKKRFPDLARESITNICRNAEYSGASDFVNFICFILDYYPDLDIFEKMECTLTLFNSKHKKAQLYLIKLLKDYIKETKQTRPSITIFVDIIKYLLISPNESLVYPYIKWFCTDSEYPYNYIYKTIISIQRDSDRVACKEYLDSFYIEFFFSDNTDDNHKILSAQYILQNKTKRYEETECVILLIAQNLNTPYNTRADSADLLIKLGSEYVRKEAITIISELGKDISATPSISANKQNVHLLDESVNKFLLTLGGIRLDIIKNNKGIEECIKFDNIVDIIKEYSNDDKINNSLLRIKIDQIIYPGSQSLSTIFIRIYQMINKHENKELLMQRLIEELIDMADTCSSGHCSRLVNVFSGIDGFIMNIGWQKQIESNISGRLTKKAKMATCKEIGDLNQEEILSLNDEYRSKILSEMIEPDIENRLTFNTFFLECIGSIKDEMYEEFVGQKHITDEMFDLYFRQGLMYYEIGIRDL